MLPVVAGRYEVLEKLREGGMGAIYRVRDLGEMGAPRVLKVMKASVADDPHAGERFRREAEMVRALSHPNVAALHELAEALPGTFYMVLELVDGPSLSDVMLAGRLLPVTVLLDLAAQALDGLHYLHERGIVHRDVSPENVMVAEEAGRLVAKLIDLGVAKRADEEGLTTTGVFVGKLRYASPEQLGRLKAGETIDGRSDVYSMGCVLYHLLTGAPAYLAETPQAWIRQHLLERPRPFARTDRSERVPEPVRDAVLRALSKERDARFASAADFAVRLRLLRDELAREAGSGKADEDLAASRALLALARRDAAGKVMPVSVEELAANGLTQPPPEREDATVRLGGPDRTAAPEASPAGPRTGWVWPALAASALLLAAGTAAWLSTRGPEPAAVPAPQPGALLVVATPWGRVASVTEEGSGQSLGAPAAVTPCRLEVPAGRWRVVVRGEDGGEAAVFVEVRAREETRVHVDLPGFDLEAAVRSVVGDAP